MWQVQWHRKHNEPNYSSYLIVSQRGTAIGPASYFQCKRVCGAKSFGVKLVCEDLPVKVLHSWESKHVRHQPEQVRWLRPVCVVMCVVSVGALCIEVFSQENIRAERWQRSHTPSLTLHANSRSNSTTTLSFNPFTWSVAAGVHSSENMD